MFSSIITYFFLVSMSQFSTMNSFGGELYFPIYHLYRTSKGQHRLLNVPHIEMRGRTNSYINLCSSYWVSDIYPGTW